MLCLHSCSACWCRVVVCMNINRLRWFDWRLGDFCDGSRLVVAHDLKTPRELWDFWLRQLVYGDTCHGSWGGQVRNSSKPQDFLPSIEQELGQGLSGTDGKRALIGVSSICIQNVKHLKTKNCCYFVCISLWPRENVGEASLPAHAVSNPETYTHQDGNSGSLLAQCVGCCCSRVPKDARSGFGFSRTTLIEQVLVFSIFKCIDQTRSWLFCLWLMDTSAPENWPASQNPIPKSG